MMDIGGGLSFQLFLYDPSDTVLTTWDKSYSFDIAPGKSYKVKPTRICIPTQELLLENKYKLAKSLFIPIAIQKLFKNELAILLSILKLKLIEPDLN